MGTGEAHANAAGDVRLLPGRPLRFGELVALDGAAAAAFVAAHVLTFVVGGRGYGLPGWLHLLVVGALGVPLALRRIRPRLVLAVVLLAAVAAFFFGVTSAAPLAVGFALYLVALTEPARRWVPTRAIGVGSLVGVLLSPIVGTVDWWQARDAGTLVVGVVVAGCAWTLGRAVRERRASATRAAEQLAERAVTEERLRIARELHDVVAHNMSLIAVKAGVANHVLQEQPEEAHDALRVIETTSRGALTEMRHLLGVLRSGAEAEPDPAPGLDDLSGVVEHASAAGVRVRLDVRGVDDLPEAVRRSTYRIVQEAITNVVRHAAARECVVTVEADRREVRIEVADDGHGPGEPRGSSGGHGLVGMRERVAVYGGTLTAGPRETGGFAVVARLPYQQTRNAAGAPS